jgi:hypothetical protein
VALEPNDGDRRHRLPTDRHKHHKFKFKPL